MGWHWGDTQVTLGPSARAGLWQGGGSGHPPCRHVCTCKKALCSSHPHPGISCSQVQGQGGSAGRCLCHKLGFGSWHGEIWHHFSS